MPQATPRPVEILLVEDNPDVWVVFRRVLDAAGELKADLCNAPTDTPTATLAWLSGRRWPVEQAIKEGKEELGLDHAGAPAEALRLGPELRTWHRGTSSTRTTSSSVRASGQLQSLLDPR